MMCVRRRPTTLSGESDRRRSALFIAQFPPPHHGQSVMASLVRDVFLQAGLSITVLWSGGARNLEDVGRRTLTKYFGFMRLVFELSLMWLFGRRFDLAYLGFVPWAHTALRDALLALIAKGLGNRVFVHVHGDGFVELLKGTSWRSRFIRSCLRSTEVLAITAETARNAARLGLFARVIPLSNTCDDPGHPKEPAESGSIGVGWLGNLDPRKGVMDFVDVVGKLRKRGVAFRATVAGATTTSLSVEALKDHVANLGLADHICVLGYGGREMKAALLTSHDVLLYLSRHDLSPLVVIEALAHGNIPIVIDCGGLREMVGPQLSQNVLPANLSRDAAITRAVDIILGYAADRSLLARDKMRARERYLKAYHPEAFRGDILSFINEDDPRSADATPHKSALAGEVR